MLPPDASRAEIDTFRHAMGYDQPVVQFLRYLAHVAVGDLERPLRFDSPCLA
jgi:peptide/nickel transport system permease protein